MKKKLLLPVSKDSGPSGKWLSMDDYLKFVAFNLRYTVDKKAVKRRKRLSAVKVPFEIK